MVWCRMVVVVCGGHVEGRCEFGAGADETYEHYQRQTQCKKTGEENKNNNNKKNSSTKRSNSAM